MTIPGPHRKKAVKISYDEEEWNNSFRVGWITYNWSRGSISLERYIKVGLVVAQKLLLEANRINRLFIAEGYKELDNWFLVWIAHTLFSRNWL